MHIILEFLDLNSFIILIALPVPGISKSTRKVAIKSNLIIPNEAKNSLQETNFNVMTSLNFELIELERSYKIST
jgi:hypothetical protein